MRCDEVIHELAAPTADRDRAELADHLAGCPGCAEWARRAEGLDRLWEATRPAEPSPAAWDAVWAKIAGSLADPSARPGVIPGVERAPSRNGEAARVLVHPGPRPVGRGLRLAAIALVGLAQAAAILLALGLAWQSEPRPDGPGRFADRTPPPPAAVRSVADVQFDAEIEASSLMVIVVGRESGRVEDRTPPEMNLSADIGMEITNAMESIATPPAVAAR